MIELPSKLIGTIKINSSVGTDPLNEVSTCSVLTGDLPKGKFEEFFIQQSDK